MRTVLLLLASNVFMNVAWYWHLLFRSDRMPLWAFIGISWLIALPEYCLAVPANRYGSDRLGGPFTGPQLKILQEGLTLTAFLVVSLLMLRAVPRWTDLAGMSLILAGVAVAMIGRTA
jgi:uncharacterized protein (DUF486 family)